MGEVLRRSFFTRHALLVAPLLLGMYLVRKHTGKEDAFKVVEVEAYLGEKDKASHARHGRTERNKIMFEEGGCWYIYFIYGVHHMLNIVTGEKGNAQAVLIRGIRNCSGPGRITRALTIDKSMYGMQAVPASGLWFEKREDVMPKFSIKRTPRIGVAYAGAWAKKPYRFVLKEKARGL